LKSKIEKKIREVIFLKSKENKIVNKIDKFSNLLLEFSILFESKTTLCCSCNIIARFKLTLIESRIFLIILTIFDYLERDKDRQVLLF